MGKKKSKGGSKTAPNSSSPVADSIGDASVASAAAPPPTRASELEPFSEFQRALAEVEAVCNASAQWAAAPHDCVSALDGLARQLETLQSFQSSEGSEPQNDAPRGEPSPAEWDLFWEWVGASANGEPSLTRKSTVEVGWFGDAFGNGCRAARDLAAGEVVLRVPTSLMLSLHVGPAASYSPVPSIVAADPLLRATPTLGLALLIAHEKLQGSASTFTPYLEVLPTSFDVPLSWQPSDLEPLSEASPSVFTRAVNGWRMALKQYVYLVHKAAREPQGFGKHFPVMADPTEGGHLNSTRPLFSLSLFRWALATAITRQNEVPAAARTNSGSTLALIPLWDMCNHSNSKDTDTSFVAGPLAEPSSSLQVGSVEGALECRAVKDIAKDTQVYIFYGKRPNSDLLLYSGFVPEPRPEADSSLAPLLKSLSANSHDRLPTPLTWELEAREGDASSREALLKVRLLLCRSLGLTPTNTNGIWELALPLSIATIVAAAAEGGSGAPSSGVAERLQLKHAFMASSADVPNSKAWLRACLEAKKSEGGRTAEPPASIEWSTAALALLRSVLAKHAENALQRTQCATAATTAAKGDPAQRRADQVRKLVDAELLLLQAAIDHAEGIINS